MIDPGEVAILVVHGNGPYYEGRFALEHSWPELQMRQLRRHTPPGFTMVAVGNRIMPEHEVFLGSCREVEIHCTHDPAMPLFKEIWRYRNWLVEQTHERFRYLITLDSDAFPITDGWLDRYLEGLSEREPVAAVQRLENGDTHSDRSFMAFSSRAWRQHRFDFANGPKDAGCRISAYLDSRGLSWRRLTRSNAWNPHSLTAGLYDSAIYHHAAGGRLPLYRINQAIWREGLDTPAFETELAIHNALLDAIHHDTDHFLDQLQGRAAPTSREALLAGGHEIVRARPEFAEPLFDDRDRGPNRFGEGEPRR